MNGTQKPPYLIGGIAVASAAALGLLALGRKAMPQRTRMQASLRQAHAARLERISVASKVAAVPASALAAGTAENTPSDKTAADPAAQVPAGGWVGRQWHLAKAAVTAWSDDYAPSMGAALSYYTLFSLGPLLLIVIAVAGMAFGQEAAQGEILGQLRGIMGEEGAIAVEGLLKAAREPAKGIFATVLGIGLLVLGATAVFAELQSALDRIWETPAPKSESGIWSMVRARLLSFGLVLGVAFMLMVSLVVSAALAALGNWWGAWFQGWEVVLQAVNFVVSFGIFTALFAMIYKIMPRAKIAWGDVWTGAAVTALLFSVGKILISLYLGKSALASGFGAAGSFVVLLAWVYYSAQIFLLGAEYTWAYAKSHGSHMGDRQGAKTLGARTRREAPTRG